MRATHRIKVRHKGPDIYLLAYRRHPDDKWMQWPDNVPILGQMIHIQNLATRSVVRQLKTPSIFKEIRK